MDAQKLWNNGIYVIVIISHKKACFSYYKVNDINVIITTQVQLSLHNSNCVPFVLLPTSKPRNFNDVRGIVLLCNSRCGGDGVSV